ncbi:hypothetical protein SNE35_32045 [Paucibacter sp. R3-3]|uniref:Uncharacterized protein n=1 Tax=Roseateles agri TaxID=3098619 RepID=A0ABU5DS69_9BURK|nr:hypothetical protein [Paucibacter sp. R3-3]MDY0749167.1 hypothetical protein [Paucibacter sp. R3-3]
MELIEVESADPPSAEQPQNPEAMDRARFEKAKGLYLALRERFEGVRDPEGDP